jgi:hypothetical protein
MDLKKSLLSIFFSLFTIFLFAQDQKNMATQFDPLQTFAQNFYSTNGNEIRSASGAPGPKYWQNRADYKLDATIDTIKNSLTCSETIHYLNNSPDSLESLWLELDQNTYREDARSNFFSGFGSLKHTNGFQFESIAVSYGGKTFVANYIVNDTRMQIRLPGK